MSLSSRIEKLEKKLTPKKEKIYFMGWADCTWTHSEGLTRLDGESKDDFCNRVYQVTKKQFLWFD